MENKEIEILAPVGNMEMYEAAKKASAEAIYISTKNFGARAYANNFEIEQIKEIIKDAHLNDIKVYVTLNTLIKDREMDRALETVEDIYQSGADGILIQDMGLFSQIRHIDDIEFHASTQASIYNLEGSKFLTDQGFDRIVIARETPIDEIKRISNQAIEVEAFVHGSLCVSVSGQCLMSSFIGGRSGNRGACAQACRKEYRLISNNKEFKGSFLSPADLSTIHRMDDLIDANISSLKIEGRMKKPSYVYTAVKEYKKALEKKEYRKKDLSLASNRSFTEGFIFDSFGENYLNNNDDRGYKVGIVKKDTEKYIDVGDHIDIGDTLVLVTESKKINLTSTNKYIRGDRISLSRFSDASLGSNVVKIYSKSLKENLDKAHIRKHPLDIFFSIDGKEAKLILNSKGHDIEILRDVDIAKNAPLTNKDIEKSLSKLGDSPFYLENLEIYNDNNSFMPISHLNGLRRDGLNKLLDRFIRKDKIKISKDRLDNISKNKKKLSLEIYSLDQEIDNLDLIDRIYVHKLSDAKKLYRKVEEIFYIPPKYLYTNDYDKLRDSIYENLSYIDGFSANNISDIPFFKEFNKKIHLEFSNNIINSYSYKYFKDLGIDDISLSQELKLDEIKDIKGNFESIVYGRIPVMTMRHCTFSSIKKCGEKGCGSCPYFKGQLISDMDDKYIYIRNIDSPNRYTEIFQRPIKSLSINLPENIDMLRIVMTDEEDISKIIMDYHSKYILNKKIKGVEDKYLGHYDLGLTI